VQVRFGPNCPSGFLPVFSVATDEEAKALLVLACQRGYDGEYYAPDLIEEQTLENLAAFSQRLHDRHEVLRRAGRCTCAAAE
jgi:hypothetical protein